MIVSLHIGLNVLFLLLQEKYQKKQSKGMLSCLLPQAKPLPLETLGAHRRRCWSTLTYILIWAEMSRFLPKWVGAEGGWARIGTFSPRCKNPRACQPRRGIYKGDGFLKSPPCIGFFSPFSCRIKKKAGNRLVNDHLQPLPPLHKEPPKRFPVWGGCE